MLIQFDREDSENLVLTFDNSESDAEQMQDFIAWLELSGLEFSKLKMKIPGVPEKVTNLFVKKPQQAARVFTPVAPTSVAPTSVAQTPVSKSVPVETVEEESDSETQEHVMNNEDSNSNSESEEEPVSRTKKTTKRVSAKK